MRKNNNIKLRLVTLLFLSVMGTLLSLFFAPLVFAQNAPSERYNSEVNAVIREYIAIGVDEDGIAFAITPTAEGVFASNSTRVHVYTNAKGYKLYISSGPDGTELKHLDSSVTKTLSTLDTFQTNLTDTGVIASAFPVNSWGYSLNGTDFFGVSDSQTLIRETDGWSNIGDSITTLHFGAKANLAMPAGTYHNTVTLTAMATIVPPSAPTVPSEIGWVNSATISPESVLGNHNIKTYEYIVTQEADFLPDEDSTATGTGKELVISRDTGYADGIYYVYFRAVDMADTRSAWSNRVTVKLDATGPTTTLSTTSDLRAKKQTATLTCADEKLVSAYYFGTKSNPDRADFTIVPKDTDTDEQPESWTDTKEITAAGTYYLFCRDKSGTTSNTGALTYYTYNTVTLLDTLVGTAGNYIQANYAESAAGDTYLAPKDTAINPADFYTIPTPYTDATHYRGYSTSFETHTAPSLETTSRNLTANTTFYTYFDRFTYILTLSRETGISNVTGEGVYKHGATANIDASVMPGYIFGGWEVLSGNTPADVSVANTTVLMEANTELKAKNGDGTAPEVEDLVPKTYNTFDLTITDNTGVTDYCVKTGSATKPEADDACWVSASGNPSFTKTITVSEATTYAVYGKDAMNNITNEPKTIEAFAVTRNQGENTILTTYADSTLNETTGACQGGTSLTNNFVALKNTPLCLTATPASGYVITEFSWNGADIRANLGGLSANVVTTGTITSAAEKGTLSNATYLQDVTAEVCANTPVSNTMTYTLTDRRLNPDGSKYSYLVKKLGGRCWMTQNLALPGEVAVNHTYSDISTGRTFTLPTSSNSTSNYYNNKTAADTKSMYNGTHIGSVSNSGTTTNPQGDNTTTNTGSYYTFEVATAGTGSTKTTQFQNTTESICPRGWRIPSFNNPNTSDYGGVGSTTVGGDFGALTGLTAWSSWNKDALTNSGFASFGNAYTSNCNNNGCPNSGYLGSTSHWWSSTVFNSTYAYLLHAYSSNGLYADSSNRAYGFQVRCVIGDESEYTAEAYDLDSARYMQQVTSSTCSHTQDTNIHNLIDARDGKAYQTRKIGDRCWMVQNLALAGGTTVSSTLSNVAADFTLPASSNAVGSNTWTGGGNTNMTTYKNMYNGSHIGVGTLMGGIINESPVKDNLSTNSGAYYTLEVAAGGTSHSVTGAYYNTVYDICPRGWHLPSANDKDGNNTIGGDVKNLIPELVAFDSATGTSANYSDNYAKFQFGNTKYCNHVSCPFINGLPENDRGSYALWAVSTVSGATTTYKIQATLSEGLTVMSGSRNYGFQIRCVVK